MTQHTYDKIRIGPWMFSAQTGILTQGDVHERLENRAAALLEFLCHRSAELVTHKEIINHVWEGRFVSPNSVAVVISDIRRALGDEARKPTFIETLPKRGYRLVADVSYIYGEDAKEEVSAETGDMRLSSIPAKKRHIMLAMMGSLIFAVVLVIAKLNAQPSPGPAIPVFVNGVVNETGDTQYAALTTAVSELLSVEVARHENLRIGPMEDATVIISGKLILWDGHPSVALHAVSTSDGQTMWSGMASGPETLLPRQVKAEVSKLSKAK